MTAELAPSSPEYRRPPIRSPEFERPRAWGHWLILLASTLILGFSATMTIEDEADVRLPGAATALPELCSFRRVLGLPCPGCGVTRCFISLAHGDLSAAWSYNPGGVLFFLLVAAQIPVQLWQLDRIRRRQPLWRPGEWSAWLLIAAALLMIANWGARLTASW